jgi:hypothetical protein
MVAQNNGPAAIEKPLGVKVVMQLLQQDLDRMEHGGAWFLQGVIDVHQRLLTPAIEEGRTDDAKTAATYIAAAAELILRNVL